MSYNKKESSLQCTNGIKYLKKQNIHYIQDRVTVRVNIVTQLSVSFYIYTTDIILNV
jgi:hypothetical protein